MKVDVIKTSFAGGEFGPSLFGRSDIAQYANACETVENMLPRSYGPVISMPGTRYVATVSDSTLRTRLIPFIFNQTDAYAIEMGDFYMRFFTNRGQVVTPSGTEDLASFTSSTIAHWKMNDNVSGTGTTVVLDATGTHNGTASTVTSSLSTTAIVSTGFDLDGRYHVSVADHANFTRTASSQPMTVLGWFYYSANGSDQAIFSKSSEYEFSINSSDELAFLVTSGNADTKLLIHADGTDASTSFTDSSTGAKTVTANGNAQVDTSQKKFGTASALFDGTGDYLSVGDSADWNFGSEVFTVDCWIRFASTAANMGIVGQQTDGNNFWSLKWSNSDGQLRFRVAAAGSATVALHAAWTPSADTWYHVAAVRGWGGNVNDWALTVNGVQIGVTLTDADVVGDFTGDLWVGRDADDNSNYFNGWIDEVRVVKGTAVWTENFTPPTSAYQASVSNSWTVDDAISEGWHYFAVVFKGTGTLESDCKIYIDSELSETTFSSDPSFVKMENTSSLFRIGTTSSAGAKQWQDKLDNFAFLHDDLTATEILTLYSSAAYQISTVFTESEVFDVHFTQLNDIIWLTHPNHPPQKLVRTSANEWTISDAPIMGGPFLDTNTNTSTTLALSATTGTINVTAATGKIVFTRSASTLGHHNAFFAIGGLTAETSSTTGLKETAYVKITHVINSYTATATVIKNIPVTTTTSNWAEGAWSAVRGYPSRVSLHDWRLFFARTNEEPQKVWGSRVFSYEDMALDTEADDDGLNLPLASNQSNEIQFLASSRSLIAGTYGGAFPISAGSADTITPDNAKANEETGVGATSITPKILGNFIYYVQRFGKKIREMFYFWDNDTYKAVDATILSPHILGDGVVDMAVQQSPEPLVWCVLTTGTLAIMTREVDQQVQAWSRHTTSGTYTSIAIIPSQTAGYDEAWVIVERYIAGAQRKYVEFFENIEVPDRQDKCLYLHSALSYDAYESTSTSSATISLSASSGSVTLTSSTAYFNGGMIGKRIRAIDENGTTIGQGQITATASTTSITLSITTTFSALSYSAGRWGVSVATLSGLDHLNAKTVGILADGQVESLTRTVASESVTLSSNYWVISIGLSYDQILFTLPPEAGTNRGTAQGKIQRYNEISLKVNRSTQGFKYGTDADNLDDINLAFTPTVTSLYTGILPPQGGGITMRGGYKRGAQVYIKNSNPLPIEVLSLMGALDTNDK